MTLPVSSYEALLVQVRELTHETILLQRQLSSDLYNNTEPTDLNHNFKHFHNNYSQAEQNGKVLYDNLIQRCDTNVEIDQRNLIDRNELALHSRFKPHFGHVQESFSTGELTARLIAWKNKTHRYSFAAEEERLESGKQTFTINPESSSGTSLASVGRVGVEVSGTTLLHSWGTTTAAPSAAQPPPPPPLISSTNTREGRTIVRPYYAAGDPPLSPGELNTTELQSASTIRLCPTSETSSLPRSIETRDSFRERCHNSRPNYRNHRVSYPHKGHDLDTMDGSGENMPNSGTPSPELYPRDGKGFNEDGSSDEDSKHDNRSQTYRLSSLYHGTWPVKRDLSADQQMSLPGPPSSSAGNQQNDMASVMSFSSSTGVSSSSGGIHGHRRLGAKVDVVYSLLGMLGSSEGREDMSATLLAMSNSIDSCLVMRQSGCLPLLVQLIHAPGQDHDTRERASRALHNVIHARSDEKVGRREARVLRLLEQVRDYCQALRASLETVRPPDDLERHPGPTIAALMKLSFDEAHRHAMCQLGGLHAISELIEMDHASHGSGSDDPSCITLRRYAGMALTNLTFGDGNNKALLCSFRAFMKALVSQLQSLSDDLRQVTASVLRNLSWRADSSSKQTLREVGAVTGLMRAAMEGRKESTLKSILSALWNLSAHCSTNKVDICAVEGALAFLVDMLSYEAPSKTLSIVENAGGILRNVSSHIAVREDYRKIVRERDCLQVLLRQLRSPSLTVVSNACGALWNLSARCPHDQRLLWDLGAVPMLRSLVHSKHKMISMGSSAALKNLLSARPAGSNLVHLDSTARGLGLPTLPSLVARRQRALEQEIDQNLAETCDNIEPSTSPINKDDKFSFKVDQSFVDVAQRSSRSYQTCHNQSLLSGSKYSAVPRSDSRESMRSVTSTHSDTIFERLNRHVTNGTPAESQIKQQSSSLHSAVAFNTPGYPDTSNKTNQADKKYALRYKNSIVERLRPTELGVSEIGDLRCTTSTMSWATGPDQESACSQTLMHSSHEDNLSPMSLSKLSIGPSKPETSKRSDDPSVRNTRAESKYSSVKSPIGKLTFATSLAETTPLCEKTSEKRSPTFGRTSEIDPFDVYAETDLDEPTNYSLRYAERNSDEDEKHSNDYLPEREQHYCPEGIPYEASLPPFGAASDILPREHSFQIKLMHPESESHKKDLQTSPIHAANDASKFPLDGRFQRPVDREPSDALRNSDPSEEEGSRSNEDTANTARLNSLVLNDEQKIISDSLPNESTITTTGIRNDARDVETYSASALNGRSVEDDDDDDEDLLAACIHIGMQNNRHRRSFGRNSLEKTPSPESNLARYQTRTALNQVETSGSTEDSDRVAQSDSSIFNIKMSSGQWSEGRQGEFVENGYASFEDNFNVAKEDDKITVQYEKLQEYSCDQREGSNIGYSSEDVAGNNEASEKPTVRQTRANSVEDNLAHDEISNDVTGHSDSGSNRETRDSESMESFDSVERSEQALLQLCIKPGVSNTEAIPMSEENMSDDVDTVGGPDFKVIKDVSTVCTTVTSARHYEDESPKNVKSSRGKSDEGKNVEDEYRRQRDPDAMIASLDRLTATLVQQTEAMRERESSTMRQSVLSDTWTEDSPNEGSYPSISVSAPFVASFKSDIDEEPSGIEEMVNQRESDKMESSMTNSKIIEREAIRLAEAVSAEASRQSMDRGPSSGSTSQDLETVRAPSMENLVSLTTSYMGMFEQRDSSMDHRDRSQSHSLSPLRSKNLHEPRNRKKSLPVGVMAKRALGHGMSNVAGSLESLLNDCSLGTHSQLENVMPPSLMDELLDNGDMENSMLSVASITSEIADSKDHDSNSLIAANDSIFDLVQPVANVLSMTCMKYAMHHSANDSISECLENINPPSLLNEVSDMDDSTMDANTETMCSETLCIDAEFRAEQVPRSIVVEQLNDSDNDTDEVGTSINTESCYSSSAESTPKKRPHKSYLTPKQKRQLAKERFKTYTIAAEFVKKEEDERRKCEQTDTGTFKIPRRKCSPFSKLTPKQRRQEDPARFQTQVVTNPLPDFVNKEPEEPQFSSNSSIPTMTNLCGSKTYRKKRGDKEGETHYQTLIMNEPPAAEDSEAQTRVPEDIQNIGCEAMQTMLQRNADIVLHTLNETSKVADINNEEAMMLDCETLSLVSNDSESEQTSRMRQAVSGGLTKRFMTSCAQRAANQRPPVYRQEEAATPVENDAQTDEEKFEKPKETSKVSDSESDDNLSCDVEEQVQESKRPRIVKPGAVSRDRSADSETADKSEPGSPKGIRGRRKALYSTPNTRRVTPHSSPLKQTSNPTGIPIGRSNTSPVVRATRATTLRQNTNVFVNTSKETARANFVQKIPQASNADKRSRNAALSKRSSIPQRGSSCTSTKFVKRHSTPPGCSGPQKETKNELPPTKPLERQGTFTKDEPEVENARTVVPCFSPTKSKIAKPTRGSPVRANPAAGKSKILVRTQETQQQSKITKCSSSERIQSSRVSPSRAGGKNVATVEPAVSSRFEQTNVQSTPTEAGRIAPRRIATLGQRSSSNSSIVSSPTTPLSGRKIPKEAASKIASLWKKVEDSKAKQRFEKPDTRQWITAETSGTTESREASTVTRKPPAFRMFRSSTFEGVPQECTGAATAAAVRSEKLTRNVETPGSTSKYRNSCDLSGMTPADAPCKIPIKFSDKRTGKETPVGYGTIVLRKQRSVDSSATTEVDGTKRLSRLGSFIRVDAPEVDPTSGQSHTDEQTVRTPVSAIVPPFNYNPRQTVSSLPTKTRQSEDGDIYEFPGKIVTSSAKVTTV
ncbi:uncharacterized protein [Venturia canescens]|uniref:uncharacterized protein isoform X2 n=1 Tax=Venturia canescens TaxID=32260 RepID=UPI001C9BC811|nr:uncharacterized protein LOC122406888 isoform X2 [Venturia canescens]